MIRNIGRTTNLDDLRNMVIARIDNGPVYLRQVAEVDFAPKFKRGDAGYMGKPAVIVSVEKQPNIDTISLTKQVEQALSEISASLPNGIKADQILFRQANFIDASIRSVQKVMLEAVVAVAIVLFAFLLNWRTTADFTDGNTVSILTTATIFYLAGLSINTMTLGVSRLRLANSSTMPWWMSKIFIANCGKIVRPIIHSRHSTLSSRRRRKSGRALFMQPPLSCWSSFPCSHSPASRAGSSPPLERHISFPFWRAWRSRSP